jgi:D-3-phosphoglycerate dehydrogenase
MKDFKKIKIFIADKIHLKGVQILKKTGFAIIECYGLENKELIDSIERRHSKGYPNCLIIRSVRKFTDNEIYRLSKSGIRVLCTASSGFDNIPLNSCKKYKIKVLNVPKGNYISAAEHTMAFMLNIMKNVTNADKDMKKDSFKSLEYVNYELSGKKVGIIGVGRVGSYVAKICKAFGAEILGNDIKKTLEKTYKWIKFKQLDDLLKVSDIVSIHTPLDESTHDLLNRKRLRLMKKSAIILNCARGGIVNENALISMLKSKKIYYAGVDVFQNEPNIKEEFRNLDNVILTPHLAGKTVESIERISVQLAERIIAYYK